MELLRGRPDREPAFDVALAATLLSAVASGTRGALLRVYRPISTVVFGRRDAFLPGFPAAADAARAHGFAPVLRAQGGRAAAYDERCLVLDQIMPSSDSMSGIQERFERDAERQAEAIRALGVDARVGEVPGEYCPGPFTVNARGERKLLGSAQRIVRGGWLLSTVVVVDGAARLRAVLDDVYGALGLEWSRDTVGAIADEAPGAGIDAVEEALLRSYRVVREGVLTPDDLAGAAATIGRFEVR